MAELGNPFGGRSDGFRCPVCGSEVERVHRNTVDRWVSLFRSVHRYQCTTPACGWHGLLGRDSEDTAAARPTWRTAAVWFLVGALSALAAVQATRLYLRSQNAPRTAPVALQGTELQSRSTPPGQDYDGQELPADDKRVTQNTSPLTLRQSCAWGVPGGNPYRGTVSQALIAAQLPPVVVRKISEMAERGWTSGQVEISRNGIFTVDHRRSFGNTAKSMGYGNSMCFNMRVNFKPGHVEHAALYEATDEQGRTHTVMVPYVCQNVAVLGERFEETDTVRETPEPATWTIMLLALGAMAWTRRRKQRPSVP